MRGAKPVVLGGPPLVSLLPREMLDATSRRATRRALLLAVAGVALITGALIAASGLAASSAQSELDEASQQLAVLNGQLAKFSDLQREQQQVALGNAAVKVGSSTSIDWDAQISAVESAMPAPFTITGVSTTSAVPGTPFEQSSDPLDPTRVATMNISATATSIDELPRWLRELRALPAYASARPLVGRSDDSSGTEFSITITLDLDKDAFVPQKEIAK